MRMLPIIMLTAALTALPASASPRMSGEERLAKLLEGRTAGAPVSCIRTLPTDDMKVIDGTALVFGRGNLIYVNRTQDPTSIDDDYTLLLRRFGDGSSLCDTDTMTKLDRVSHFYAGNVFLGEFVPYRRVPR